MLAATESAPIILQFVASDGTTVERLEQDRRILQGRLAALPNVSDVATEQDRPMSVTGSALGVLVELTPVLKAAAEDVGAVTLLVASLRGLATELKSWRDVFIEVAGKRKRLGDVEQTDIEAIAGELRDAPGDQKK
jgi:hypothetical protein